MNWDGKEIRQEPMEPYHNCRFEQQLTEMYGNIKELLANFKHMNGMLIDTKRKFDEHDEESTGFRDKVNMLWAVLHATKWVITLIFGSAFLTVLVSKMMEGK